MRITCPNCQAVYEIPDLLAFGIRKLRCVCCGASWDAVMRPIARPQPLTEAVPTVVEEPASEPAVTPVPAPGARMSALASTYVPEQGPRKGRGGVAIAWVASVALVLGGGCAAWRFQAALCHAWPPLGRLAALVAAHS